MATLCGGRGRYPNWFLLVSIRYSGANCWAKVKGSTSRSQEEEEERGRDVDQAVEWRGSSRHVGLGDPRVCNLASSGQGGWRELGDKIRAGNSLPSH